MMMKTCCGTSCCWPPQSSSPFHYWMNTSNWRKISCCQVWNLLSQKWSFYCSSIIITWMKWYHGRSTAAPIKKNGIPFIKLLAKPKSSRELEGSNKKVLRFWLRITIMHIAHIEDSRIIINIFTICAKKIKKVRSKKTHEIKYKSISQNCSTKFHFLPFQIWPKIIFLI